MNPVLQLQAKIKPLKKISHTDQRHQATIASLKPQINSLTAQLTQIEQQKKAHQLALQQAERREKHKRRN
ncbi:hypothetical protein [Candidatus Bealeia paramacronuclearis]|uniref:hypothetical protein n=1 Tax=Candidatus Bealeia paramacronuclearis TaxID=1921001 RepID=UPI002F25F125